MSCYAVTVTECELPFDFPTKVFVQDPMEVFVNPKFTSKSQWFEFIVENGFNPVYHRPSIDLSGYQNKLDTVLQHMNSYSKNDAVKQFTSEILANEDFKQILINEINKTVAIMNEKMEMIATSFVLNVNKDKMDTNILTARHNTLQNIHLTNKEYLKIPECDRRDFESDIKDGIFSLDGNAVKRQEIRIGLGIYHKFDAAKIDGVLDIVENSECHYLGDSDNRQWHIKNEICIAQGPLVEPFKGSNHKTLNNLRKSDKINSNSCDFMSAEQLEAAFDQLKQNGDIVKEFNWVNDYNISLYEQFLDQKYETQLKSKALPLIFIISFSYDPSNAGISYFGTFGDKYIYIGYGIAIINGFIYHTIDSLPGNSGSLIYIIFKPKMHKLKIEKPKIYRIGIHLGGYRRLNKGYLFNREQITKINEIANLNVIPPTLNLWTMLNSFWFGAASNESENVTTEFKDNNSNNNNNNNNDTTNMITFKAADRSKVSKDYDDYFENLVDEFTGAGNGSSHGSPAVSSFRGSGAGSTVKVPTIIGGGHDGGAGSHGRSHGRSHAALGGSGSTGQIPTIIGGGHDGSAGSHPGLGGASGLGSTVKVPTLIGGGHDGGAAPHARSHAGLGAGSSAQQHTNNNLVNKPISDSLLHFLKNYV